jgi:hypothetical protein
VKLKVKEEERSTFRPCPNAYPDLVRKEPGKLRIRILYCELLIVLTTIMHHIQNMTFNHLPNMRRVLNFRTKDWSFLGLHMNSGSVKEHDVTRTFLRSDIVWSGNMAFKVSEELVVSILEVNNFCLTNLKIYTAGFLFPVCQFTTNCTLKRFTISISTRSSYLSYFYYCSHHVAFGKDF